MFKRFCLILSLAIGMLFLAVLPALAETVDTAWVRRYNGPENGSDGASAIAIDGSGNVYVTGTSYGGSGTPFSYATAKYYPNGDTAWVRRYNEPGNDDRAFAIAVDSSGNVYVTGWSYQSGTWYDYATIKYKPSGDTAWVRRYSALGISGDFASDIALDDSGNVYVTGKSEEVFLNFDYATVKYDSLGNELWVRRYNGPADSSDEVQDIVVDGFGNVYVTGYSWGSGTNYDYVTIKYYPDGDTAWVRRYNGPADSEDVAYAIAIDGSGNVYVTGGIYAGSGAEHDYATIKYYSNGDTAWVRRYNGPANSTDCALAIAVDDSGNVYVTGFSFGSGTSQDYATIKYYPNGDTAWVRRYNGPGDSTDWASTIAVDHSGNVYVTGWSWGSGMDYATVKYDSSGNQVWAQRYNGPSNSEDRAHDIAVDGFNNVYVTGASYGSGTDYDYATIKYVQGLSRVSITDDAFVPEADTVTVGDSVRWTNNGAEPHTTTSDAKSAWDSDTLYPGESFTFQFNSAGSYPYHSKFHPSMTGIIVVLPSTDVKDETEDKEKPSEFSLFQNYPNPFNQSTKIEFTLAKSGFVSLNIYDLLGRKVRTLVSEHLSSGYKSVLWDGKNNFGKDVASGIYFYQMRVGDFTQTKKLVLLK
jgi:plastocyanin